MTPLASCSHSLQSMPVARAMRAAAANQIMMLAVNPLSSVCTNVHRDQYCTTRIEFLVILSFTHFYGRAAAELSFSDLVLRTFTGLMKTDISYNSLNLYLYSKAAARAPTTNRTANAQRQRRINAARLTVNEHGNAPTHHQCAPCATHDARATRED